MKLKLLAEVWENIAADYALYTGNASGGGISVLLKHWTPGEEVMGLNSTSGSNFPLLSLDSRWV